MTFSVLWTLLPRGIDVQRGKALLSLVASPRVENGAGSLAGSPLADWPGVVDDLGPLFVATQGGGAPVPATVVGPQRSSALWQALFKPVTPVKTRGPGRGALDRVRPGFAFAEAARSLEAIYAAADGDAATRGLPADHPSARAVAALAGAAAASGNGRPAGAAGGNGRPAAAPAELAALAARTAPGAPLEAEMARLRERGDEAAATALPLLAVARALRSRRPDPSADGLAAAGPLAGVAPIRLADFHQVVGVLLDHPALALRLGLRTDLETAAPAAGPHVIRATRPDGTALNGLVPRAQPWSAVVAEPATGRFTMATQPPGADVSTEIRAGMLAVASNAAQADYVLTDVDVPALVGQLESIAIARAAVPDPPPLRLPVRRDAGLTLAQAARADVVVTHSQIRTDALAEGTEVVTELARAADGPVLFADDVTTGYRIDVATDGGRFRSLMRRRVHYRVGTETVEADDEGRTEAMTGVQQLDGDGIVQLTAGEEVFCFDGWSLVAPKPGPKVDAEAGPDTVTVIEPGLVPGYDLRAEVSAAAGTLPRLRFGSTYELRARAVDLAGNSIAPGLCDPTQVLPAKRFERHEALPSPPVIPRRRFTAGESLTHWVVRSDALGAPLPGTCERHLAPPACSQSLAERHGLFDAALGEPTPARAAARDALLAVARREAGTWLDPTVPGPDGNPVPAAGIAVVTNDPNQTPHVALPPPRGEPLPNGAYVIHDADAPRLPSLPDPAAAGVALHGLPGRVVVHFAGGAWPNYQPTRVVVRPVATGSGITSTVKTVAGRPVLFLDVAPGVRADLELATTVRADRLGELAVGSAAPEAVLNGEVLALSARQAVTIVHAVERPLADPALPAGVTVDVPSLGTTIAVRAEVAFHRPTTGRVDLEASWTDTVDTGVGPVVPEARRLAVGSLLIGPPDGTPPVIEATQFVGDTRHRRIDYQPVASAPFREYFAPLREGDRRHQRPGAALTKVIPNRARPARPVIDSLVPNFQWTRAKVGSSLTSRRECPGVRVWLRRPWLETGEGELLGVVVHASEAHADTAATSDSRLLDFVSRVGSDPLEESGVADPQHLLKASFPRRKETRQLPLADPAVAGFTEPEIAGHEVRFDPQRGLWYADVDIVVPLLTLPFVRLALVRYQPASLDGCHVSPVVLSDFVQLQPRRRLVVRRQGTFGVRVTVQGLKLANSSFTLRQERRIPDPLAPGDLGSDAGVGADGGWEFKNLPPGSNDLAELQLDTPQTQLGDNLVKELRAGRIVVEEHQEGWAVLGPDKTKRVIYVETVERADIGIGS